MRILFPILPVTAHLLPLAPLAWSLMAAGHEVRVVTPRHPTITGVVTGAGLTTMSLKEGIDLTEAVAATMDNPTLEAVAEGVGVDRADSNLWQMVRHYATSTFAYYYPAEQPGPGEPDVVGEMVELTRSWNPDLVLWDPLFFPAAVAAQACGTVHARLLWSLDQFGWIRSRYRDSLGRDGSSGVDVMAEAMRPTLERFGVAFDESLLVGRWSIDPSPPEMRLPVPDVTYVPVRPVPYNGPADVPDWLREAPRRPRVCLTLGTSARELFAGTEASIADLLEALGELDIEVIATLDATQLSGVDRVPDNVRTFDYVPLHLVLPTCAAVVHQGGNGTIAASTAHRVPQLLIPKDGSDYVDFANFVAKHGAGIVIDSAGFTVDNIREQLVRVMSEPSFREGVHELHEVMASSPTPVELVADIERRTEEYRAGE